MPVNASVKLMSIFIIRSCPFRLKSACAFSSRTMMISPGSSPGSWSPSPEKVTFCPSSMPLSTDTSKIFLSRLTLRPLHFLHLSLVNPLPLSVTLATHRLDLLHHARPKLLDSDLNTSPSAVGTLLDSARLATDPLAAVADDVLLEGELAYSPVVHVLQGDGQLVHQVLRSAWAPLPAATKGVPTTTTKEHVKDVHGVHSSASS